MGLNMVEVNVAFFGNGCSAGVFTIATGNQQTGRTDTKTALIIKGTWNNLCILW